MLKLEEKIRMSDAYINECSRVKDEVNGWLRISGEVQEMIANKFGYKDIIQNTIAVNLMRSAHIKYSDDIRFNSVSVYVRNNLAKKGNFYTGKELVDAKLFTTDKNLTSLKNIVNNKPTIVISSSAT